MRGKQERARIPEEVGRESLAGLARVDERRRSPHRPRGHHAAHDGTEGGGDEGRPPAGPGQHCAGEKERRGVARGRGGQEESGGPSPRGSREALGDEDQSGGVVASDQERCEPVQHRSRFRTQGQECEAHGRRRPQEARPDEHRN